MTPSISTTRSPLRFRTRSPLATLVLALGLLALLYNLFAAFPTLTTSLRTSLQTILPPQTFCAKDVGDAACCELFLATEPCMGACRAKHLDRETWEVTEEYDICAEECLREYEGQCKGNALLGSV